MRQSRPLDRPKAVTTLRVAQRGQNWHKVLNMENETMTNTKRPAAEPGMGNMRSRFRPLAEARLNGVLEKLDYLADMAQRNRYHYTDEEIQILEDGCSTRLPMWFKAFRLSTGNRPVFSWQD